MSATAPTAAPLPEDHAAALLIVGLAGPEPRDEELQLLRRVRPGGVILFRRNVESAAQLERLVAAVREAAPDVLLYSDSEGGRVDRLATVAGPAPAGADLAAAPAELSRDAGRWVGESLRLFGLDVDLAPVVDLDHGIADNALDGRYLGTWPEPVVERARAFLDGLHEAGVGGCLKHFPGLGSTEGDTHVLPGRSELSEDELVPDLAPFAALGAEAGAVMVSHAVFPALDPEERPSSLSPAVLGRLDVLLGGASVVRFSDDLEMEALAPAGGLAARAAASLAAGCDLLSICHTLEAAPEVARRLAGDDLTGPRARALGRLATWRRRLSGLLSRADTAAARGERPDLDTVRARLAAVTTAAGEARA